MSVLITDVAYDPPRALAAGVWASDWSAAEAAALHSVTVHGVADYEPGHFYRRELPCLMALVVALPELPDTIVVDGHAWLGRGRPGLGAHLHRALDGVVVVGVAKSRFAENDVAVPILRGSSKVPLYVSACGMAHAEAARRVSEMHGPHRVPTLLRRVDALSRGR